MLKIFELIGRYFILMGKVFSRPEKAAIYRRRIVYEMESLGIDSIGLTAIISVFIGAVITLQMCINLDSPFIPRSLVGYATRETMILEFSSTVVALILAGKVGSSIASEIGTMRIITSISAFYGYYAKGNSLEVGAASTRAVVASSVVIMIFNLILTQVLLI